MTLLNIIEHDNDPSNIMPVKDKSVQTKAPYRIKVFLRARNGINSFPEDDDYEGEPINVWAEGISQEDWDFLRDQSSGWMLDQGRKMDIDELKEWIKKSNEIGDRIVTSLGYNTEQYELGGYFRFGMDPKNLYEIQK